jgi:hypothetical protein
MSPLDQSAQQEAVRQRYGGSEPSVPSFLRPYYVRHNAISKSQDLGATEILIADFDGTIGTQAGTNTLYFRVELPRPLDVRVVLRATGASTDRLLRVGVLDGNRAPLPLTSSGRAYRNEISNTPEDESRDRLPAGTYYITVASDQWQALPYAISIFVGSYALLVGAATGAAAPQGRLPLVKARGAALLSAPLSATLVPPAKLKRLAGPAGGDALPALTLSILRGVALGRLDLTGQLKQTWRLTGVAQGGDQTSGTLTINNPGGGGYGY